MATRQSFRAKGRDTSPGHWPSRIPSTLSLNSRLGFVPSLNLRPMQPPLLQQTSRSFSTCADNTDELGEHHLNRRVSNGFVRQHATRLKRIDQCTSTNSAAKFCWLGQFKRCSPFFRRQPILIPLH